MLGVFISQHNKVIKPVDGIYSLQSDVFNFHFESKNLEGFLLGATIDEEVYRAAIGEADLEVNWFFESGMAEELLNPHHTLFISNDAPSYWYFADANDHRLNMGSYGHTGQWNGIRTVSNLYDVASEKYISMHEFKDKLYVFLYKPVYDEDYSLIAKTVLFHSVIAFSKPHIQ